MSVCLTFQIGLLKWEHQRKKNYCLTVHLTALCGISVFLTLAGAQRQKYITGRSMADYKIKPHHRGSYLQLLL